MGLNSGAAAPRKDAVEEWRSRILSADFGQEHLLQADASEEDVARLVEQLKVLDSNCAGGVVGYVRRARKLLEDSKAGKSRFEGREASVPLRDELCVGSSAFDEAELAGTKELGDCVFVLVAGGLGERLGSPDIKISLPCDLVTGCPFIEVYCRWLLALQQLQSASSGCGPKRRLPLVVMTSDDTHLKTLEIFNDNSNFGLDASQLFFVKQEKVPALTDDTARFAVLPSDRFVVETKPHGHGDIHRLLHLLDEGKNIQYCDDTTATSTKCSSFLGVEERGRGGADQPLQQQPSSNLQNRVLTRWLEEGRRWLVFLQDTNALSLRCLAAVLGVSSTNNLSMNFVAIPRKPGEAVGAICRLSDKAETSKSAALTVNVEYNELEALLEAADGKGDIADVNTGLSRFPGNVNFLVFDLRHYDEVLCATEGQIPEFVNPKYADASKTTFKSPTRLECMMQEIAWHFILPHHKVGVCKLERWFCFTAVKNNRADAALKAKSGLPPDCAFSAEADVYKCNAKLLEIAARSQGVEQVAIAEPTMKDFGGVSYPLGPLVVLEPSWAVSLQQMKQRLKQRGKPLRISARSTLVIEGDVEISGLDLDGCLILRAEPGGKLLVEELQVKNAGWQLCALQPDEEREAAPAVSIRGFQLRKFEEREEIARAGEVRKLGGGL